MNALEWTMNQTHQVKQTWEDHVLLGLQEFRNPLLSGGMRLASFLANSPTLTLFALLAFALPVLHTVALSLAIALLSGVGVSQLLKRALKRPRPRTRIAALAPLEEDPDSFSMPSGHTTAAFSAAVVLATLPGWEIAAPGMASLVGISHVYGGTLPNRCCRGSRSRVCLWVPGPCHPPLLQTF